MEYFNLVCYLSDDVVVDFLYSLNKEFKRIWYVLTIIGKQL